MRFGVVNPGKSLLSVRIALIAGLILLLSGWTTCDAMFVFSGCEGSIPQPKLTSLSPNAVPGDGESVLLTVNGASFAVNSQIMWNGNALSTTFIDSDHLQTAITQQTFALFGGSTGSTVQISVSSPASVAVVGCPNRGNSATLALLIN
jgi:hypothetical protein